MARITAPSIQFDHSWELLASYGPHPEVWTATGYGSILVARRTPGGKEAVVYARLSLSDNGIFSIGANPAAQLGTCENLVANLLRAVDSAPPMVQMPLEHVAEYLYGAYPWGVLTRGVCLEPFSGYLNILKPPPGSMRRWQRRLVGPGGLTPEGLVRIVRKNPQPLDLPADKEWPLLPG